MTGRLEGLRVGSTGRPVGPAVGLSTGDPVGDPDTGASVTGAAEGPPDGLSVGGPVGLADGLSTGDPVGDSDRGAPVTGAAEGPPDGLSVGDEEVGSALEGSSVTGDNVGLAIGDRVGWEWGTLDLAWLEQKNE